MGIYLEKMKRTHMPKRLYAVAMFVFKSNKLKPLEREPEKVIVGSSHNGPILLTDWWSEEIASNLLEKEVKYDIMEKCNADSSSVFENVKWYKSEISASKNIPHETLKYLMPDIDDPNYFNNYIGLVLVSTLVYI